eukprot:5951064-Pyramimonas_sp.AAC.2
MRKTTRVFRGQNEDSTNLRRRTALPKRARRARLICCGRVSAELEASVLQPAGSGRERAGAAASVQRLWSLLLRAALAAATSVHVDLCAGVPAAPAAAETVVDTELDETAGLVGASRSASRSADVKPRPEVTRALQCVMDDLAEVVAGVAQSGNPKTRAEARPSRAEVTLTKPY